MPFSGVDDPLEAARVLDAMADGIVIVDRSGGIVFANAAIIQLSGYSAEELLGSSIEMLVPERWRGDHVGQRHQAMEEGDLNRPMGTGRDIRLRRSDGIEIPVDIALSTMGDQVVASVRDVRSTISVLAALADERRRGAVLAERARIARELHDGIIQQLFAVGLGLRSANPDEIVDAREDAVRGIDGAIRDLRMYVTGLTDESVPRSLTGAITELVSELRSASSVPIEPMIDAAVAKRVAVHGPILVNFVREAVSNSIRHAKATRIEVNLRASGGAGILEIVDDGVGFDPATVDGLGSGLSNLKARAAAVGGDFELESWAGKGSRVALRIPLRETR